MVELITAFFVFRLTHHGVQAMQSVLILTQQGYGEFRSSGALFVFLVQRDEVYKGVMEPLAKSSSLNISKIECTYRDTTSHHPCRKHCHDKRSSLLNTHHGHN